MICVVFPDFVPVLSSGPAASLFTSGDRSSSSPSSLAPALLQITGLGEIICFLSESENK